MFQYLKTPILSFIAVYAGISAIAQTPQRHELPNSMWDKECTLEKAFDVELLDHLDAQKPRHTKYKHALEEAQKFLDNSEYEDNTPLIDQMNAEEVASFETYRQVIANNQFVELIEGKRERDLWAVMNLVSIATEISLGNYEVPVNSNSRESTYWGLLLGMREVIPIDSFDHDIPNDGPCNVEHTLYVSHLSAIEKANSVYGKTAALSDLEDLADRYGAPIDPEKLNTDDRNLLENDIYPIISKLTLRAEFAKDLYRIARLEAVSKLHLKAMRQDHYEAPADLDYSGTNFERMIETGEVSTVDIQYSKIIAILNEAIPADIITLWDNTFQPQTSP